ncbi:EpsG family protein [Chitinophaga terrae (ex Kim and Jung 2007)]|nr:EpsG family protein [Chitinophaga terrae (ex Kim and Jung 2007)]
MHSRHLNAILMAVTIVLASAIVGFRPLNAGYDTKGYVEAYELLDKSFVESFLVIKQYFGVSIEPFFWGYAWLLNSFGLTSKEFLFCTALISISLTGLVYRKIDPKFFFISFLGVLFSGSYINLYGNAIRQGLAMPFFLLALYHGMNGSNIKVIIYAVITFLFHQFTGLLAVLIFLPRLLPFRFYGIIWLSTFVLTFIIKLGLFNFVPGIAQYLKGSSWAYLIHPTYLEFPIYSYLVIRLKLREDWMFYRIFKFVAVVFLVQTLFVFNIYAYNRIGLLRFILEPIIYTRIILSIKPIKAASQIAILVFFIYGAFIFFSQTVQDTLSSTPSGQQ